MGDQPAEIELAENELKVSTFDRSISLEVPQEHAPLLEKLEAWLKTGKNALANMDTEGTLVLHLESRVFRISYDQSNKVTGFAVENFKKEPMAREGKPRILA